jgi:thymidylate synthase (FAD)
MELQTTASSAEGHAADETEWHAAPTPPASDADLADALPCADLREIALGPAGYVRLVDAMPRLVPSGSLGPEAAIVQAARVSYGAGTKAVQSDLALLRYLLRHEHMTPFEMVSLKFCICAPLFTARQWMRHRAGAFNEESARYSVIAPAFYCPSAAEVRVQSATNRQGSGVPVAPPVAAAVCDRVRAAYASGYAAYSEALGAGVARELARVVLPEGRYTTFYWAVNLRNAFGFLKLRRSPAAQDNIRAYADAVYGLLRRYCPRAIEAYDDYIGDAVTFSALELGALRTGALPERMTAREKAEWKAKQKNLDCNACR